jgi:cytochrome c-type biogenesis protein CcmF
VIGGALTLYAWRAPLLKSNAGFDLLSRESFLLFNNILLVVAAASVLGGTLAPLIADTFGQSSLSVGPPYFRPTFLLAVVPLLLLLSIGIHANWKRGRLEVAARPLFVTLLIAVALGAATVFGFYAGHHALAITGIGIGSWIILSSLLDPVDRLRRHLSLSRAVLGMTLAHIGMGVAVIALTGVESYTSEQDIALASGASAELGGYEFKLMGTQPVEGPNYSAIRATVIVSRNGRPITTLYPESRTFWVQQQTRKVAGIYNLHGTDLFIALGDDLGAGRWSFRAQIRPLITLLWLGPLFMALGGALALSDKRYRQERAAARAGVRSGLGAAH